MKNNNIQNIQKMSKVLETFSKVIAILMLVACGLSIITIVVSIFSPENLSMIASYSTDEYSNINIFLSELINETSASLILALIMLQANKLFKNIKDSQTPFSEYNATTLKKISKLMIALAVVPFIVSIISDIALSVHGTSHLEIGYILIAVLFTCVSYIFAYGSELQKESDELL